MADTRLPAFDRGAIPSPSCNVGPQLYGLCDWYSVLSTPPETYCLLDLAPIIPPDHPPFRNPKAHFSE